MGIVGLFNVISAIFVESTLSAAEKMQSEKKALRLQDEALFAVEVSRLVEMLLAEQLQGESEYQLEDAVHDSKIMLSQRMEEVMALDLPCATIRKMARNEEFRQSLNRLDIEPEDHQHLANILDPDGSGNIDAVEFVSGIERLRGMPRRSDVISAQLMIRSLQEKLDDLNQQVEINQLETQGQLQELLRGV